MLFTSWRLRGCTLGILSLKRARYSVEEVQIQHEEVLRAVDAFSFLVSGHILTNIPFQHYPIQFGLQIATYLIYCHLSLTPLPLLKTSNVFPTSTLTGCRVLRAHTLEALLRRAPLEVKKVSVDSGVGDKRGLLLTLLRSRNIRKNLHL